mmetsp:Transcript_23532/g.57193  ORF Transcript_23532/g.57193 Transcript_23532/m.57193 type:complete len:320 (-) Transcript_23532:40-999(-)
MVCSSSALLLRRVSGPVPGHLVECGVQHVNTAELLNRAFHLFQGLDRIHQLGVRELHLIFNGDANQVQGCLAVAESVDRLLGDTLGHGLDPREQQLRPHLPAARLALRLLRLLDDTHTSPHPPLIHLRGQHAPRQRVGVLVGGDREAKPQRLSQLQDGLGVLVPCIALPGVFLFKLLNCPFHPLGSLTIIARALRQLTGTLFQGGLTVAERGHAIVLDPLRGRTPALPPGQPEGGGQQGELESPGEILHCRLAPPQLLQLLPGCRQLRLHLLHQDVRCGELRPECQQGGLADLVEGALQPCARKNGTNASIISRLRHIR